MDHPAAARKRVGLDSYGLCETGLPRGPAGLRIAPEIVARCAASRLGQVRTNQQEPDDEEPDEVLMNFLPDAAASQGRVELPILGSSTELHRFAKLTAPVGHPGELIGEQFSRRVLREPV
jgi:hypothetical protein